MKSCKFTLRIIILGLLNICIPLFFFPLSMKIFYRFASHSKFSKFLFASSRTPHHSTYYSDRMAANPLKIPPSIWTSDQIIRGMLRSAIRNHHSPYMPCTPWILSLVPSVISIVVFCHKSRNSEMADSIVGERCPSQWLPALKIRIWKNGWPVSLTVQGFRFHRIGTYDTGLGLSTRLWATSQTA